MTSNIKKIKKRNGQVVDFDSSKIVKAIFKAITATNQGDGKKSEKLCVRVVKLLNTRFKKQEVPTVEQVQDIVEEVLILEDLVETAKAFILYREQRRKIREAMSVQNEASAIFGKYIDEEDWQIKENANMAYSLQGLNNYVVSALTKEYWLNKIYPKEIREALDSGDLHIHDLDVLATYCCGWDLYDLLLQGFGGVPGKVECAPPKHLNVALCQIVNFFYTLQGECYSEDTQVLTDSGWKYFPEVKKNDKVFTRNSQTNAIELQKPVRSYKFDYDGELYNFKTKKLDLLVTPNHNMLVNQYYPGKKEYASKFVKAKDFNPNTHWIPKHSLWQGERREYFFLPEIAILQYGHFAKSFLGIPRLSFLTKTDDIFTGISQPIWKYEVKNIEAKKILMDNWLKFFGFYIAEGNNYARKRFHKNGTSYYEYTVRIFQKKGHKAEQFEKVLEELPFHYRKRIDKKDMIVFTIQNKQLYNYLEQFGTSGTKFIPQEIKNLSKPQLKILFDWLMKGDGYVGGGNTEYSTKSKQLADDVQEIVLKLGWNANIQKRNKGKFKWFDVSVSKTKHFRFKKTSLKKIGYKGKTYCLEVPNHTLYVRRNGMACWCGNSAGAQAFSSFDTLLAPFIRYGSLSYKQVEQALQGFLFNSAIPTRVGFQCLSEDTKIFTPNGWKSYEGLKEKDIIYSFNIDNGKIEEKTITNIFIKQYNGEMYNLRNRSQNQLISPRHRVVRQIFNANKYTIEPIEDILKLKSPCSIPVCGDNINSDWDIRDEQLQLIAWILSDTSKIIHQWLGTTHKTFPPFLFKMSKRQAILFLDTYVKGDGWQEKYRKRITTTDKDILEGLQALAVLAGYNFVVGERKPQGISKKQQYVLTLTNAKHDYIQKIKKVNYKGIIWSVHTENETVIAKRKGQVFITGNTPFTNITLDIIPAVGLKKQPVIIGGKPQKETYGEFQREMNMFNKAFYNVMMRGDKKGRPFTFPIPTINITKDFPWENPDLEPMWQATAKYGVNYFSNFIKSDMKPEEVRSMCPLSGDEKVLTKSTRGRDLEFSSIKNIYYGNPKNKEYEIYSHGKFVKGRFDKFPNQEMIKVILDNNHKIEISREHLNFVLRDEKSKVEILKGKELGKEMYLPYSLKKYKGSGGNEDLGYFVGAFAGDGSFDRDTSVVFSLENKRKKHVIEKLKFIGDKYFGAHFAEKQNSRTKLYTLKVHSRAAVGLCKDFVAEKEREKHYKEKLFTMSLEFRKGVLKGHYDTDGGNRNRIYTSSKKMVESLNMLAATMGTTTSIYKDSRKGRFGESPNYAVLIYQLNRKKYGRTWFKKGDKLWVRIKQIQKLGKSMAYCFEVSNDEPMFTVGTTGILTHNCRLRLSNKELYKRGGGLFGSNPLTGSIGVVTINLPRIGYLSKTKTEFFERLTKVMDLAKESLEIKRKAVNNFAEKGLYPYSCHYLQGVKKMRGSYFSNHFSTIGLIGMNECFLNFLGEDIGSENGKKAGLEVLDFMREKMIKYQEETGNLYNLEATPGEGVSFRLPLKDREKYPDIITAGVKEAPYYTNSSQLPVNYTDDIFKALDLQDEIQCKYTGGTVNHLFLGEQISDVEMVKRLVKKIFDNYHLPYITITPTFSICPTHGYLSGEHWTCPKCDDEQQCEVYSRVVGYYRPVKQWHKGKTQEFKDRKEYRVEEIEEKKYENK